MHSPGHFRLHLSTLRRLPLWLVAALFLTAGLFAKADAWAASAFCFPNSTIPNSSIPIAPLVLYLTQTGDVEYAVSLCTTPTAPVTITTSATPTGKIALTPSSPFTLTDTISETVSVELAPGAPLNDPFTATIVHATASADPTYNWGATNVPTVTVHFLPPLAVDDVAATERNVTVEVNVLSNDLDRLGQGLTRSIESSGTNGLAAFGPNNTFRYRPNTGFAGADSFTYRITDGIGNTDTANVTVIVAPANQDNPQAEQIDPVAGGETGFNAAFGPVAVQFPAGFLDPDVPTGDGVIFAFGDVTQPTCSANTFPTHAKSTGNFFDLSGFAGTTELTGADLAKPLVVDLTIPAADVPVGTTVMVVRCAGSAWTTAGIVLLGQGRDGAGGYDVSFSTTGLGEFAILRLDFVMLVPSVVFQSAVAASE